MSPQKVEDCVKAIMADPDFKPLEGRTKEESAWAVCQEQHKKRMESSVGQIQLEMIAEPAQFVVAKEDGGEVMRFRNAILAVAETNRNRDTIDEDGIAEIAASLPGRPIDWEHEFGKCIGVFTEASPVRVGEKWGVATGGLIWADRFPDAADGVRNGKLFLSVEAKAKTAQCSLCGGVYDAAATYCQHLLNRMASGASRVLKGLKAVGGALTKSPAGTGTNFDAGQVYFVASHSMEGAMTMENVIDIMDELQYEAVMAKQLSYKERENLSNEDFALIQKKDGQTIRRFPIYDCAHAANAKARLPVAKDLSSEERAEVARKADAKLNSDECKSKTKEKETMKSSEELQGELDAMTRKLDEGATALQEAESKSKADNERINQLTAKIKELEGKLSDTMTASRVDALVTGGMAKEEAEKAKETVAKMDEATFNLYLAAVKKPVKTAVGSGGFSPETDGTEKPTLVLRKEV